MTGFTSGQTRCSKPAGSKRCRGWSRAVCQKLPNHFSSLATESCAATFAESWRSTSPEMRFSREPGSMRNANSRGSAAKRTCIGFPVSATIHGRESTRETGCQDSLRPAFRTADKWKTGSCVNLRPGEQHVELRVDQLYAELKPKLDMLPKGRL